MAPLLLNICELSCIEVSALTSPTLIPGHGILIGDQEFDNIPLVGLAKCELSSKVENKTRTFTAVLSAHLCSSFDAREKNFVFLARCVNGDRYLIGSALRPYPLVNTSVSLPGSPTEPSRHSITVEYTSTSGLLRVLD